MAITWLEAARGSNAEKGGNTKGAEIPYHGEGTGTVADAKDSLLATAPATLDTLILDYVHAEEVGGGHWEGSARYKSADTGGSVGSVVFSFNTSGGTKHFTDSKKSTGYAFGSSTPPDVKGTIGDVQDGVPAGCDVVFPQFEFQLTVYKPNITAAISAYVATLYATTAKTNKDAFTAGIFTFQPGEVLFLGVGGAKRSGGDWEISLKFAASPNRTSVGFGIGSDSLPLITVPAIKGWEYVDVRYEWWESESKTVKKPSAVYLHKVYDEIEFAPLLL